MLGGYAGGGGGSSRRNAESLFRSLFYPTFLTSPDLVDVIACSLPEADNTQHSGYMRVYTYTRARLHIQNQRRALAAWSWSRPSSGGASRQTCPPARPVLPHLSVPLHALSSPTSAAPTSAPVPLVLGSSAGCGAARAAGVRPGAGRRCCSADTDSQRRR